MSADDAARLLARLDYPMFVVTAAEGEERAGCLVGFVTQTSIHPTRLLVCLSRKNRTLKVAERSAGLAVHVVPSDRIDLAELFGGETGDDLDKFARCSWSHGPMGLPVLDDCPSWLAGRIMERLDLGDHVGHLLEPVDARLEDDPADGLDFRRARVIHPGHEA